MFIWEDKPLTYICLSLLIFGYYIRWWYSIDIITVPSNVTKFNWCLKKENSFFRPKKAAFNSSFFLINFFTPHLLLLMLLVLQKMMVMAMLTITICRSNTFLLFVLPYYQFSLFFVSKNCWLTMKKNWFSTSSEEKRKKK